MNLLIAERIIAALAECPHCAVKARWTRGEQFPGHDCVRVKFVCGGEVLASTLCNAWYWPNPCPNGPADPRLMEIAEAVALEMRDAP